MDSRDNPVFLSFSCGNWFLTHVRISVWMPLIILCICLKLGNLKLGLLFGAVLVVTLLVHEFSHILMVRWTGGIGNEILVWPLGGLAFVQPAPTFRSQFLTPAAGPLSNLIVCGTVLAPVLHSGTLPRILNPFKFPISGTEFAPAADLFVLIFWCNWVLLLANLLPVFPLDGIRMLLAVLKNRTEMEAAAELAIKISFGVASLIMGIGLLAVDSAAVVFFGAVVLILSLFEWVQMRTAEVLDDSFMGYDFSQGYTSLEKSARQNQPASRRRGSWLDQYRERRRLAKERRARLELEQAQQQVDEILEKVHQQGINSLSDAERRQLNRASARLRDRGKQA